MTDRVFVCPKCKSLCLAEDWNEKRGKCGYCCTNKYHAQRTELDGEIFDSKHEAGVYYQLRLLAQQGVIGDLQRQVSFRLEVNGLLICKYIADFRYICTMRREVVVVDAKGVRTPTYNLKKRLMKAIHNIEIVEM